MQREWPVVQVRVARPTSQLDAVVRFYRDGLGLAEIGSFTGHAGYDGVMLGLPGRELHLEFTTYAHGSPCPAPTRDNLLVLYVPDKGSLDRMAARLIRSGFPPVPPENPYWLDDALTFEDPDGWRVVLANSAGLTDA